MRSSQLYSSNLPRRGASCNNLLIFGIYPYLHLLCPRGNKGAGAVLVIAKRRGFSNGNFIRMTVPGCRVCSMVWDSSRSPMPRNECYYNVTSNAAIPQAPAPPSTFKVSHGQLCKIAQWQPSYSIFSTPKQALMMLQIMAKAKPAYPLHGPNHQQLSEAV